MNPNTYFGIPGKTLNKLWDPTGGMLATRERSSYVFSNKNGGTRTIRALDGARSYSLNYGALGRKTFEILNAYQQGHMGPGPFVLIDPGRRNLLTVNQSSATSQTNDTRGWTATGPSQSIAADNTQAGQFPNVLRHAFTATVPASSVLTLDRPSTVWPGIPVLIQPYTFWFYAAGGPMSIQATIDWLDLSGAVLSTATSGNFSLGIGGSITKCWITSTPPAGTVWGICRIKPVLATIINGASYIVIKPMFNEGSSPDMDWAPGTGIYPVTVMGLPEKYGFAEPGMMVSPTLLLQEVR